QGWYLATSPSDPETQNRLNEISKDAGGSFSCEIPMPMKKPVIYLYPTRPTDVLVKLDLHGDFVFTHPRYDESIRGWSVTAYPD
ncbi:MAG TPA: hypothetical protein DF383_00230, partial [Deltaproteobacteria bacterium]|nr:hypothetical protein [Deltaproteobacteria bacterium]